MERFDKIEAVPRLLLIAVLKRRAQRSRRYCSLPAAYLFLGLFMAAMMTRSGVISDAFDFDAKCVPRRPPIAPAPRGVVFFSGIRGSRTLLARSRYNPPPLPRHTPPA